MSAGGEASPDVCRAWSPHSGLQRALKWMKGGCGGFPLVLHALGSPEASDHDSDDILSYAEGPDPCDAG